MAIDAKVSFLRQIEKECADKLTVTDLQKTLRVLSDVLEDYDIKPKARRRVLGQKDELLDAFIEAMKVQGRSPKSIERYQYIIRRFMKYARVRSKSINVYHVRSWLTAEKERGLKESTLESNRQVLSAYFGWLFRESLIERNPMANVGSIKVPKKKKQIFTDVDLEKMYKACEQMPKNEQMRDRVIIRFLMTTGCRVSEMCELDRDAIDLRNQECVVHGKGDKERVVFFDAVMAMMLEEYMDARKDDNEALIIGKGRRRLEPGGVRAMLKHIEKISGVQHIHPHKFRRTLATDLARHGMPIQEVANVLGHEKIDTTMEYVVMDKEETKTNYRRYA